MQGRPRSGQAAHVHWASRRESADPRNSLAIYLHQTDGDGWDAESQCTEKTPEHGTVTACFIRQTQSGAREGLHEVPWRLRWEKAQRGGGRRLWGRIKAQRQTHACAWWVQDW